MEYKYINYDKIINKITNKDKFFHGNYIIDPYQNCEFGCKYCDSSFEKTIFIKNNFLQKTENEIKELSKGTIIIGSVVDPYQKIEENLKITRNLLKIIKKYQFNIHILTKSNLILRDIDILSKIKNKNVTISIISINEKISNFFEKNVPTSIERFELIKKLVDNKINTGLALIPILPYIIEPEIENVIKFALKFKSKYILYKFLELRGNQKLIFYNNLFNLDPTLLKKYKLLYKNNYLPNNKYIEFINHEIYKYCKKFDLPNFV